MIIDLGKLSPTGRDWYERLDAVLREEVGRRLPGYWTADDAHRAAWIAVETAAEEMRAVIDEEVAKQVKADPADAVGDVLFDWAHEGCDDEDGCHGGSRPWWNGPAQRLTDPCSAVVAVAVEHQLLLDEVDAAGEAGDDAGWVATLRAGVEEVGRAWDAADADEAPTDAARREVLKLAAWCVALVEELDRRREAERVRLLVQAADAREAS